jgi:hypothetical protein
MKIEAIKAAQKIQKKDSKTARRIAADTLKELKSEGMRKRLKS